MLSPDGPEGRFCNNARGVADAFACIIEVPHLEDPEDIPRRPHRSAILYKAQLSNMSVYMCVRGEDAVRIERGSFDPEFCLKTC